MAARPTTAIISQSAFLALDPSWSGILVDSGQTASEWNLVALESNLHHVSKEFNQQNNHDHCGWKH